MSINDDWYDRYKGRLGSVIACIDACDRKLMNTDDKLLNFIIDDLGGPVVLRSIPGRTFYSIKYIFLLVTGFLSCYDFLIFAS